MKTLQEIQEAIKRLSPDDLERLERWFYTHAFESSEKDRDEWHVAETSVIYKAPHRRHCMSVGEYLELEADSPVKHEYVAGELFAMAGVSREHQRISGNLFNAFSNRLRGGPCEVFMADFKVRLEIDRDEIFYHPDVMVAGGREGVQKFYLSNPKLIIEVLSPSTKRTDQREKALNYRRIPSLEECALIAQDTPEVTIQSRSEDWKSIVLDSLETSAEFHSIGLSLPLSQIYEGIGA